MIFLTLFSKNRPFLDNFGKKPVFAQMINTYEQNLSITQFKTYFWTTFVHKCKSFEQKQVFVKIVQKWAIFNKQSKKNHKRPKFFS